MPRLPTPGPKHGAVWNLAELREEPGETGSMAHDFATAIDDLRQTTSEFSIWPRPQRRVDRCDRDGGGAAGA